MCCFIVCRVRLGRVEKSLFHKRHLLGFAVKDDKSSTSDGVSTFEGAPPFEGVP